MIGLNYKKLHNWLEPLKLNACCCVILYRQKAEATSVRLHPPQLLVLSFWREILEERVSRAIVGNSHRSEMRG